MTTSHLPELIINPNSLSPEHHFLRVLSGEPTSRTEALRRILHRFPDFTRFGKDPANPTDSAVRAWQRLRESRYVTYQEQGQRKGLVLTGQGEVRLHELWDAQILLPNLHRIEHEHGPVIAREVARRARG